MFLFVTDETNLRPGRDSKFFIYGGLAVSVEQAVEISHGIEKIRRKYRFNEADHLKFDTRARPEHVSIDDYTAAKREVIALCHAAGARLIVQLVLHEIAKNKDQAELVEHAINTVLVSFNGLFLPGEDDVGIVIIDRLPKDIAYAILRQKFQEGLTIARSGANIKLDRVLMYATTCDGASHISSAVDIVLGGFRFVVNSINRAQGSEVPRSIFRSIAMMLYSRQSRGKRLVRSYGLITRPKTVKHPPYEAQYKELLTYLASLLEDVQSA